MRLFVDEVEGRVRCRRVVLDGYLDRREQERRQCEEGEERCDVCRGGQESSGETDEEGEGESIGGNKRVEECRSEKDRERAEEREDEGKRRQEQGVVFEQ